MLEVWICCSAWPLVQTFVFIFRTAAGSGHAASSSPLVWWLNTFFWPCCKLPVWLHHQVCAPHRRSPKAFHEHHYYPCKLAQLTHPCSGSLFVNPSFFTVSGPRTKGLQRPPAPSYPSLPHHHRPRPPLSRQILTPVNIKQHRLQECLG